MKKAGKKELYKIDVARFLKRKGLTQQELAKKISCSIGLVGGWASYRGVPSYEKCIELLKAGMTISELFGEDIARETRLFPITEEDLKAKSSDFEAIVGEAVVSWIMKKVNQ
ncbi:MAG: helix-turn-helix transcriptional regulator [Fibromonadaceae bacterium]|jgi:transcriptional regulator with XRE-family HTH domain|nr:helix-turn-helix transcriptional regulator [Fibromonadaceae bacterium]